MRSAALGFACVVMGGFLFAAEPAKVVPAPLPSAALVIAARPKIFAKSVSAKRKAIEARLEAPADLNFGEKKQVTVKEVLEQLHAKHKLSIRMDVTTFAWMMGADEVTAQRKPGEKEAKSEASAAANEKPAEPAVVAPVAAPVVTQVAAAAPAVPAASTPAAAVPASKVTPTPVVTPAPVVTPPASAKAAPAVATPGASPPSVPATPKSEAKPEAAKAEGAKMEAAKTPMKSSDDDEDGKNFLSLIQEMEIDLTYVNLREASVANVLKSVLGGIPNTFEEGTELPVTLTDAMAIDYLVEDEGIVITTRMQALAQKETRVYSIKNLTEIKSEELANLIRKSIRPWSWRSQINDFGDQLKGVAIPSAALQSIAASGLGMLVGDLGAIPVGGENTIGVTIATADAEKKSEETPATPAVPNAGSTPQVSAEEMKLVGNALANMTVAFGHASLSMLEMFHYAELPTGTIQVLPGKLIITQSQVTHREIEDLLKQLAEE